MDISRRKFFATAGSAVAAATVLSACNGKGRETIDRNGVVGENNEELEHQEYLKLEPATLGQIACTGCKACMPCPYGVDIAGVFGLVNKGIKEKTLPTDRKGADYGAKRERFLIDLNRQIRKKSQPDHCIGCYQCVEKCQNEIDIPNELQTIDRFVEIVRRGE